MSQRVTMSTLQTDATYFIIEEFDDLAFLFARWLADQKIKHIILAFCSDKVNISKRKLIEEL